MNKYRVTIDYSKPTGKFYASGSYETKLQDMHEIYGELRDEHA